MIRHEATVPLADIDSAAALSDILARRGETDLLIPDHAALRVKTETQYEDRPGASARVVPAALVFTWET